MLLTTILAAFVAALFASPSLAQMQLPADTPDWALNDAKWSTANAGTTLDTTSAAFTSVYSRVGPSDAALCDIAPLNKNTVGQGQHTWYAEENTGNSPASSTTPVANVAPTPAANNGGYTGTNPYACPGGVLTITVSNPTGNQWQSGTIEMKSPFGDGFAPKFGYYETKIKMPPMPTGACFWPSAWFNSNVTQSTNPSLYPSGSFMEFDQFELCDVAPFTDPTSVITTMHWWPGKNAPFAGPVRSQHAQKQMAYTLNLADNQWHTYGTMFTPHWVIWYRDGLEQGRFPVLGKDMVNPMMAMLDISNAGTITAPTSTTWTMSIAYARWYQCSPATSCER